MTMKMLQALTLAALIALAVPVAQADDTVPSKAPSARTQPAATAPAAQAAPVKISQQDKMKICAKEATGKKGAERKAFMKSCLSKKA
jgi:hypothetical protein